MTLVLLAGVTYTQYFLRQPAAGAEAYHERARLMAENFPFHFDRWLGVEVPVPQAAVTMLKPNFIISRRYQEIGSGRSASLVVVHCRDSRDILGHYPPVCYKGQGWLEESTESRDWVVGKETIQATRYVFRSDRAAGGQELVVDNFMILPTGQTARDMTGVTLAAQDNQLKHFGAAQVQIVYPQGMAEADRSDIFTAFVRELAPLMKSIQNANSSPTAEPGSGEIGTSESGSTNTAQPGASRP
jgi:hypothetical protein